MKLQILAKGFNSLFNLNQTFMKQPAIFDLFIWDFLYEILLFIFFCADVAVFATVFYLLCLRGTINKKVMIYLIAETPILLYLSYWIPRYVSVDLLKISAFEYAMMYFVLIMVISWGFYFIFRDGDLKVRAEEVVRRLEQQRISYENKTEETIMKEFREYNLKERVKKNKPSLTEGQFRVKRRYYKKLEEALYLSVFVGTALFVLILLSLI
jgi:hypothetical protein